MLLIKHSYFRNIFNIRALLAFRSSVLHVYNFYYQGSLQTLLENVKHSLWCKYSVHIRMYVLHFWKAKQCTQQTNDARLIAARSKAQCGRNSGQRSLPKLLPASSLTTRKLKPFNYAHYRQVITLYNLCKLAKVVASSGCNRNASL